MDLLADLNEAQRQAVRHVDGPLLVLAGAGSGKTRVIARRVAYLIQEGVAPWHVLAITFTNKAAGEMQQRVERLQAPPGATICTFHSLCARLLREFSRAAGLAQNFSIYDRDDQLRLVKEAMARAETSTDALVPARVHAGISRAKNDLQTAAAYAERAGESYYVERVAAVYAEYEKLLAANNALDFDDLLLRMAYLLGDRPEIRDRLGQRYRYVMIDEYQDTNRAQYLLAHGVALDHGNLCVTGDPDQSIYAWRGADINNILEFEADYPEATVIRLEENYRSTEAILSSASRLISHNRLRKDKALWTRREGGENVRVVYCADEHAEAAEVVRRIRRHRQTGGDYSDVAVFYRINALSRVAEQTLLARGIPYRIARGVEFYNRKEVRDVVAYLRLLVNPDDDLACLRAINTPARGIGAQTVKKLRALAGSAGVGLVAACRRARDAGLGAAGAKRTLGFADLIDSLGEDLDRSVRSIMEDVVLRSGLEDALDETDPKVRQAAANVAELITSAAEFDTATEGGTLADYLHQVSLISDVDHFEGGGGAVTLMTLHAAKGLEFPVVFVIGCEEGILPIRRDRDSTGVSLAAKAQQHSRNGGGETNPEEERRLAFVGMTRAKTDLTLTCARKRMLRGRTTPQEASIFLTEIGDAFVTVEDCAQDVVSARPWPRRRAARASTGAWPVGEAAPPSLDGGGADVGAPEAPPPEYEYLRRGARVSHPLYGIGQVVKVSLPWPQTKAEIHFEDCGPKKIVLRHAHLELLDGDDAGG